MIPVTVQVTKVALFLFSEKQQILLSSLNASMRVDCIPTFLSAQVSQKDSFLSKYSMLHCTFILVNVLCTSVRMYQAMSCLLNRCLLHGTLEIHFCYT